MSDTAADRAAAMRAAMQRSAYDQVYGDFRYVQPLERNTGRRSKLTGFDAQFCAWFQPTLIGDANYEGDVPLDSLARIRQAEQLEQRAREFTYRGVTKTVYFVGPGGLELSNKILGCQAWLMHNDARSCARSEFDEHFTGVPVKSNWTLDPRIVGWWSLNDDVLWTLDPQVAYDMVVAINGRS